MMFGSLYETLQYAVLFISFTLRKEVETLRSNDATDFYDLEGWSSCGGGEKTSKYVQPWCSMILRLGYVIAKDGSVISRRIHRCEVQLTTADGFGLAAVIEDMNFSGEKDVNNKWHCEDYVKLSTVGTIGKILSFVPGDLFKSKRTERLCGPRHLSADNVDTARFIELTSQANVFTTMASNMEIKIHQDKDHLGTRNNSVTIVVTSFKHASRSDCRDKYRCEGKNVYCIHPSLECDGHINCAFSGSSTDERYCRPKEDEFPGFFSDAMSATPVILAVIGSVAALAIIIFCSIGCYMRAQSRTSSRPFRSQLASQVDDDSGERRGGGGSSRLTPPTYESVMREENSMPASAPPPHLEKMEMPPSYDQLFPQAATPKS